MTKPKATATIGDKTVEDSTPKVGGAYLADGYRCPNCGWSGVVQTPRGRPANPTTDCPVCGLTAIRLMRHGDVPEWPKPPDESTSSWTVTAGPGFVCSHGHGSGFVGASEHPRDSEMNNSEFADLCRGVCEMLSALAADCESASTPEGNDSFLVDPLYATKIIKPMADVIAAIASNGR